VRMAIRLAVVFLIAHALYQFVPTYVRYQQFKDSVNETAMFAKGKSDADITNRVMELAAEHDIPLEREYVQVRRQGDHTYIDASWVSLIKWVPGYERAWQFDVAAHAWSSTPSKPGDAIR
jgi:hypothetical protein